MGGRGGAYRINPDGVRSVLSSTLDESEDLTRALAPLGTAVPALAEALGSCRVVGAAAETFLGVQDARADAIARRVSACVVGAASATRAYEAGDRDMAETHREAARRTGLPGR